MKTRGAMFSSSHIAMRFFKERPVTSKRFFDLEFIQRHCHTLMLRISFGFTWLLSLVARLHGMADFMKHSTLNVWKPNHNMKLSVDMLQGLVSVLHLYQHLCASYMYIYIHIIMMPESKTRTWRSMCMWRKLTWTLTHPTPQPKTWRSMCMWRKLTWTLTRPTPSTQDVT